MLDYETDGFVKGEIEDEIKVKSEDEFRGCS